MFVTFAYELLGGIKLELQNELNYRLNIGPYSTQNYIIVQKNSATFKYNLVDIIIKYKGEHKFNDQETDLEIQIIHQKDLDYTRSAIFSADPNPWKNELIVAIAFRLNTNIAGSLLEDLNANSRDFVKSQAHIPCRLL